MAGLREIAALDLGAIMADLNSGAVPMEVTSPEGVSVTLRGWGADIFLAIDPGTGVTVSGRQVSASFFISDLIAAGFEAIRGVPDSDKRPWVVVAEDVNGRPWTFKVANVNPDRGAGLMVVFLESYKQ